ncbi:hypothetical protein VPH35_013761 [Triticum aestivum]
MWPRCVRGSTASRGRREQAVPPVLVWLWRLEEEETEETRQMLNVNPTVKKREDSCDLYFWEVADVGECNYADYLVSQGIPIPAGWVVGQVTEGMAEEEDAEQKVKDVVPLIMAKQQLLNGLDSNEEMKELVKIMGKIDVLYRMIVSLFAVYVALVMYSVAMT